MRRITSALALAGMAGGLVLAAAAPALAADKHLAKPKADPATTRQDLVQKFAQDYITQLLGKVYMPPQPPKGMPPMGMPTVSAPVNVTCYVIQGTSLVNLSGLAAQVCNVANGPGATVTGGLGIDTVNILP